MTSAKLLFCLACLVLVETAQPTDLTPSSPPPQERIFISANVGDEVTLRCDHKDKGSWYYWFKQSQGQKPKRISSFYKFKETGTFHDEFQRDPRFTLETGSRKNNLKIANIQLHDSATYHCASSYAHIFEFEESTFVSVKGSGLNVQASVSRSGSGAVQPQGSVMLNCTVHTGSCDGEHSVYWFKNSQASQPGLIYTHGDKTRRCERVANTQTHMCVYNLPMNNLTQLHTGTYYCAVVSCGHILFGNGIRLDFEEKTDRLVLVLSGALTLTSIFSVLSTISMCRMNKRSKSQIQESQARFPADSMNSQDEKNLHYAALRINNPKRSRRHTSEAKDECVYSGVKQ